MSFTSRGDEAGGERIRPRADAVIGPRAADGAAIGDRVEKLVVLRQCWAMRLVILTGASGSGKTSIADAIKVLRPRLAEVLHFDSIGVPTLDDMIAGWGSGEAWQRAMTLRWMERVAGKGKQKRAVLFEGQMRLAFLRESLLATGLAATAHPILVDCDDATRTRRLAGRTKPEVANATMMRWASYMRREAREAGFEILDTSSASVEACVEHVALRLTARHL